jgi:ABC-2 type transport system ATP-binding protein
MHQQYKRMRLSFAAQPPADAFDLEGVEVTERVDRSVTLRVQQHLDKVLEQAVALSVTDLETIPVTLEEIFLAYYGKGNGGNHV